MQTILNPFPLPVGIRGLRRSGYVFLGFRVDIRVQIPQWYRGGFNRRSQRIGHGAQVFLEKVAVSVERQRRCRVPQESLHNLHISARTDRQ